jgi:hypothetical protein
MKTHRLVIWIAVVMMLAVLACGGSFSTASIESAVLAADEEGAQATTVFAPEDTFYCIVTLANAPDDTTLKAVWTAVAVEGEDPDTLIDEAETTSEGNTIFPFSLTAEEAWPVGTYKVDLYLNGTLDRTLEFEVQ